jgi:hypothetical protein
MVTLKVGSQARLYPASKIPGSVLNRIKARLTFPSPAYREAEKRGFYTGNIPREIRGWRQEADRLTVPRGATAQLVGILRGAGVQYHLDDRRRTLPEKVVEALNGGQVKVLVATGQLVGEGFDCRELSTLFLATPIKFNGRLLQYLGRVLRPAPGKAQAKVYDYLDIQVGVLENAARARQRVYGGGGRGKMPDPEGTRALPTMNR